MSFNLKEARERKGLTQQQLADMLNLKWAENHPGENKRFTVSKIVTMEKDPDELTKKELQVIAPVFGLIADQLLEVEIPRLPAPQVTNNWVRIKNIKKHIDTHINANRKYLVEARSELVATLAAVRDDTQHESSSRSVMELVALRDSITRKPQIACLGSPNSGKSCTLNALIGRDLLPTAWLPTTSTIVLLKHIDDKPRGWKDDCWRNNNVWIFEDKAEGQWDPTRINDESYCRKWMLATGDYSLIKDYGDHDGKDADQEACAIVVFVDSPFLQNCDLIDLPGFAPQSPLSLSNLSQPDPAQESSNGADKGSDRDTKLCLRGIEMADAYIYLSVANQFMLGADLAMVSSIVKSLPAIEKKGINDIPPLGNLFIVASQALTVYRRGDDVEQLVKELNRICDKKTDCLWNIVHEHPSISQRFEQTGYEYSEETLRSRFFTSEMDSYALTERFHSELAAFTEMLPIAQEQKALEALREFCFQKRDYFRGEQKNFQQLLDDHEAVLREAKEAEKAAPEAMSQVRKKSDRVTDIINQMERDSREDCAKIYEDVISPPHIVKVIEQHNLKKNKKDLQELVMILNSQLENRIATALVDRSNRLKSEIDGFIADSQTCFERTISARPDVDNISIKFNVEQAFAGGLGGLAAYGALAAWAAACGNLGGYVLVAKGVSLLAAMGIHVGGTAAATAAVAAIGGPVVLGIAIAAIAAVSAFLLFGGTWKKQIGNALVKQYKENNVLDKLKKTSDDFWAETLTAFRAGADKVVADWQEHWKMLREKAENYDVEMLNADINNAKFAAEFFEHLPDVQAGQPSETTSA